MEENVNNLDGPGVIKYVRPLDRSPDKNFSQRSEEEKKIICYSRAMKSKVRDKIDRLENEVEQREAEIEVERKLREDAEQRLKAALLDMYSNKEVNDELRQRLPRANKSDPFKTEENVSETDLSSIEEQIVIEEEGRTASKPKLTQPRAKEHSGNSSPSSKQRAKHSSKHSPKLSPKQSPKSSPKSSKRSLDFSGDGQQMASTQTGLERSHTFPYSNMSPPLRGFFGHPYTGPFMPYTGSLLSGSFHGLSSSLSNPLFHSTAVFPTSPSHRPGLMNGIHPAGLNSGTHPTGLISETSPAGLSVGTHPAGQSSGTHSAEVSEHLSPSTANLTHTGASLFGAKTTTIQSSASGSTTTASSFNAATTAGKPASSFPLAGSTSLADSGLGGSFSGYYQNYFPSQHTGNTSLLPDPPFLASSGSRLSLSMGASSHLDHNKQVSSLLNEIDALRQEIRKLKRDLEGKEMEIETMKLNMKVKEIEKNPEASHLQQAADVVEEVYTAQKKRDEATAARMKTANEERDEMVARLHQLEERLDYKRDETSFLLHNSDEDLQLDADQMEQEDMYLLLSRLESPSCSEQEAAAFTRRVELMRQRQKEVMQEEMQIVMEQRDIALAKCRKLEEELLQYQKASDADGGMDTSLKAKLRTVQQERDMAVAKSKQLDDEIQTLRIYYSLHKSLSAENSIRQQGNNTITSHQEELQVTKQQLEAAQKENSRLVAQLRTVTFDKKQLEQALESVNQDKERLQRLANVLKRKLNNLTNHEQTDQH